MTDSDKHSSLSHYEFNYTRNFFIEYAPEYLTLTNTKNSLVCSTFQADKLVCFSNIYEFNYVVKHICFYWAR